MIDLTPLDVRNKRGDFKKILRGYEPQDVDTFLALVAERLEGLVRENLSLRERTQMLQQQVDSQSGREQAVHEALVTAQELRVDIRGQAQREADHVLKEAQTEARRMIAEAEAEVRTRLRGVERQLDQGTSTLADLERRRLRFLKSFRQMLEREIDVVDVEQGKLPLEERTIDLDLGGQRSAPPPIPDSETLESEAPGDGDDERITFGAATVSPPRLWPPLDDAPPPPPRSSREDNLLLYPEPLEEDRDRRGG